MDDSDNALIICELWLVKRHVDYQESGLVVDALLAQHTPPPLPESSHRQPTRCSLSLSQHTEALSSIPPSRRRIKLSPALKLVITVSSAADVSF